MPEANQPAISVVIPCRNEAENLAFLIGEVDAALAASDYEVLIVDDGSTDGTARSYRRAHCQGRWPRSPYPA